MGIPKSAQTYVHSLPACMQIMCLHMYAETCTGTPASMYRVICPHAHAQDVQAHTVTSCPSRAHTYSCCTPSPTPLRSTWHTGISGDRSRSCLLPVWEWMFLWLLFAGCPEALRPGSACVNQYLLLLIIKNKATPCLEHTSLEFPPAPGLQPDPGPGLGERRAEGLPSRGRGLEAEGGGSCQQLLQAARLVTELVGGPVPQGPEQLVST